jgi:hypothetical protein
MALRRTWGLIAEELDAKGIHLVTLAHSNYPATLRAALGSASPTASRQSYR